jgi:hypothetical protein
MKPTLEQLRRQSGLKATELQREANISHEMWRRMSKKLMPVSETLVWRVLKVLNAHLGTQYEPRTIDVDLLDQ